MLQRIQKLTYKYKLNKIEGIPLLLILLLPIFFIPPNPFFKLPEYFEISKFVLIFYPTLAVLFYSLYKKNLSFTLTSFDIFFLLFLAIVLVSTIFAPDISAAVFGKFTRIQVSFLFYFFIFIFAFIFKHSISLYTDEVLLNILILSSIPTLIYRIYQFFYLLFNPKFVIDIAQYSSFGLTNTFSIFLILVLFSCLYFYFEKKGSYFYLIYSILLTLTVFLNQNLTTSILLVLFFLIFVLFVLKIKNIVKIAIISILILVSILMFSSPLFLQRFIKTNNIEMPDTLKTRQILWTTSLSTIFSSPKIFLIGSGPANFGDVYRRGIEMNASSEFYKTYDISHNSLIQFFFEYGILGFLFLFSLFSYSVYRLKNNIYAFLVFAILLNSFLWLFTTYTFFILIILLIKLFATDNEIWKFTKSFDVYKYFLWPISVIASIAVTLNFIGFAFMLSYPCISSSLIPTNKHYQFFCSLSLLEFNTAVKNLEKGPSYNIDLLTSASNYMARVDPNKALRLLEIVRKEEPYNANNYRLISQVYKNKNDSQKSEYYYKIYIGLLKKAGWGDNYPK